MHIFITTAKDDVFYVQSNLTSLTLTTQSSSKPQQPKHLSKWKCSVQCMCFILPFGKIFEKGTGYVSTLYGSPSGLKNINNWVLLVGTKDGKVLETTLENRQQGLTEVFSLVFYSLKYFVQIIPSSLFNGLPITSITGRVEQQHSDGIKLKQLVYVSTFLASIILQKERAEDPFLPLKNTLMVIPTKRLFPLLFYFFFFSFVLFLLFYFFCFISFFFLLFYFFCFISSFVLLYILSCMYIMFRPFITP
jgi:hypothetical protein